MFYRVNMTSKTIAKESCEQYQGLGGRALSSRIVSTEVNPSAHALGDLNKLVFATGLLSGTGAPSGGRLSLGAKSPLTGTIKESNVGGTMGTKLGHLEINAIIVEDRTPDDKLYVLYVDKTGVSLREMPELTGLDIYDTVAKLQAAFGPKVAIGCVGTAGENRMAAASVGFTDMEGEPTRQAGRGGMGAVMASRGLKAIVVDDAGTPPVAFANETAFRSGAKKLANALLKHPVTGQGLSSYGTDVVDARSAEGRVELSRNLQIATAMIDSTGLCLFVAFAILDVPEGLDGIVEMCNNRYGWNYTLNDYLEMGKQVLRDERAFNKSAGICDDSDDLPDFFRSEPLDPHKAVFDIPKKELTTL